MDNLKFPWHCLIFLCLISNQLIADDLGPPAWRGSASSTYQRWDFIFQNKGASKEDADCTNGPNQETLLGHYGLPEEVNNIYQQQTSICAEFRNMWMISEKLDWIYEYHGRSGIWHLLGDKSLPVFLNFKVPNAGPVVDRTNEIYVQITYQSIYFAPGIKVNYPSLDQSGTYKTYEPMKTVQETLLPEDWIHRIYKFETDWCPKYEIIQITPPERGDLFIDQIVIDTICHDSVLTD